MRVYLTKRQLWYTDTSIKRDRCLVDKEAIDGTMIHVHLLIGMRVLLTKKRYWFVDTSIKGIAV